MNPQASKHKRLPVIGASRRGFPWAGYAGSAHFGLPQLLRHSVLYCGLGFCLKTLLLLSGSLLVPSEIAEMHKKCSFYRGINRTKFLPSGKSKYSL